MSDDVAKRERDLREVAKEHWPVIIVGGGPAGVALSIELAQRGVRSVVLERTTALHQIPKGQFLTGRTLEHFYFWNCLEAQRAARVLPRDKQLGTVTTYGTLGSEYWYDKSIGTTVQPGFYFEVGDRIEQYLTERVLRDRLAELPAGRLMIGMNVQGVTHDDNGVSVTVAPSGKAADVSYSWEIPSAGEPGATAAEAVVLHGDYVVGCDGAHSLVRDQAGIALRGFDSGKRLTLTRFNSPELSDYLAKTYPDATTYRVLDTGLDGWIGFFGRVDDRGSFFFHAPVPNNAEFGPAEAMTMMQRSAGREFAAEIKDIRFWHGSIRMAESFGHGRLFIAGDAAHQQPP
jgi:2-polyprenyl-6-methoxyphenol hydroxylase-like FAD-dependent oxidoreductase